MSRHEVSAEIAGTVFQVDCATGQTVSRDDVVVILESMKMEIPVLAMAAGRIAQVLVKPGDVVGEGQVLVVLES